MRAAADADDDARLYPRQQRDEDSSRHRGEVGPRVTPDMGQRLKIDEAEDGHDDCGGECGNGKRSQERGEKQRGDGDGKVLANGSSTILLADMARVTAAAQKATSA